MTAARTWLPFIIATRGDDLWGRQVCNRGHPFGGIGSIRTWTDHGCGLHLHIIGSALYDKCPTGAIPKPGKGAIVSVFRIFSRGFTRYRDTTQCYFYGEM